MMRFYSHSKTGRLTVHGIIKSLIFIAVFVLGLLLCPAGDLSGITGTGRANYYIGIFLTSMSIMYFFLSLAGSSLTIPAKLFAALVLISCSVVAIIFISHGGEGIITGNSIFGGIVIGAVLTRII